MARSVAIHFFLRQGKYEKFEEKNRRIGILAWKADYTVDYVVKYVIA